MSENTNNVSILGGSQAGFALLFDLDGTLVDSLEDIARTTNRVRTDYKLPPIPVEQIRRHIGRGLENLMHQCLPEITTHLNLPDLIKAYRNHYFASPPVGKLYEGVQETLSSLRLLPDIKMGVVTNRSTSFAKTVLENLLPELMFDVVVGADSVSAPKPNPAHLLETIEILKLEPQNCWYVGDHRVDWDCARQAQVNFLGVGYGYGEIAFPTEIRLEKFPDLLTKIPIGAQPNSV